MQCSNGAHSFTDERDQQRALIEMHGLYCLSRPSMFIPSWRALNLANPPFQVRISPATAKFKAPTAGLLPDAFASNGHDQSFQPIQAKSVSAPIAATSSSSSLPSASSVPSLSGSTSTNSLPSASSSSIAPSAFGPTSSEDVLIHNNVLVQLAQQYSNGNVRAGGATSITAPFALDTGDGGAPKYTISEESWKHHAQARAILGNLIGPNGEQLTSTDPYNTTVFVGGLSPLISEDTLRTFFAPFGDIHYVRTVRTWPFGTLLTFLQVKVPAGKHCGFVQFVRKADAEKAIEKMQGFPVGGSRIRLSWGRSQCDYPMMARYPNMTHVITDKAAQAAAQAAQAAALQAQYQARYSTPFTSSVTPEQAMELLQKFGIQLATDRVMDNSQLGAFAKGNGIPTADLRSTVTPQDDPLCAPLSAPLSYDGFGYGRPLPNPGLMGLRQNRSQTLSNFSPFSPDPNLFSQRPEPAVSAPPDLWSPPKSYALGFGPSFQDPKIVGNTSGKISPPSVRPLSGPRYNSFLDGSAPAFQMSQAPSGHSDGVISRPSSGQTTGSGRGPGGVEHEVVIQDLNGTLASLNLDQTPELWKSPKGSPAGHNSGSGEAVAQHEPRATSQGRTPSP
jgi:RNA recognition motif-containing protein